MNWQLNTSAPVRSADLQGHLEAERDLLVKDAGRAAASAIIKAAGPESDPVKVMEDAAAAKIAAAASLELVRPQIDRCIKAACGLAAGVDGFVNASISGHVDIDHPEEIRQRTNVSVDEAPEPEAG